MSGFATSFSSIVASTENELNTTMTGTPIKAPLALISIGNPEPDCDSDNEGYSSDDEFILNQLIKDRTGAFGGEMADSAEGWTCCKCNYVTAQEHDTCRKCDHGCCKDCQD